MECLTKLAELKVPQWYGNLGRRVELHVFVDASDKATSAVLYVRSQDPERPRGTRGLAMGAIGGESGRLGDQISSLSGGGAMVERTSVP